MKGRKVERLIEGCCFLFIGRFEVHVFIGRFEAGFLKFIFISQLKIDLFIRLFILFLAFHFLFI